jgi:hypothetical protein
VNTTFLCRKCFLQVQQRFEVIKSYFSHIQTSMGLG